MNYYERVAKTVGLTLLLVTLVGTAIAWFVMATDAFFLVFLGILFSVLLAYTATYVNRWLPIGYSGNLALVVFLLIAATVGSGYFFGAAIGEQIQRASQQLDQAAAKVEKWLQKSPMAREAIVGLPVLGSLVEEQLPATSSGAPSETASMEGRSRTAVDQDDQTTAADSTATDSTAKKSAAEKSTTEKPVVSEASTDISSQAPAPASQRVGEMQARMPALSNKVIPAFSRVFSATFGMLTSAAIIFFVGVFLAVDPQLYRDGLVGLFPKPSQPRAAHILQKVGHALFHWLIGQMLTMSITGIGTGLGLWLLGVPLAGTVGVITALLTFIPNIGAVLALLLAMLMASSQGFATVMWVVGLYCLLQLIESNVLTPLIQQNQTSIPPALLIAFQLLVGMLTGFLGLMVATPLLAAMLVVVDETWYTEPDDVR